MAKIKARDIIICKQEGSTLTPFACTTDAQLSYKCDTSEVASPTSGSAKEFLAGRTEWSMAFSEVMWYDSSSDNSVAQGKSMVGAKLYLVFAYDKAESGEADPERTNLASVAGYAICTEWTATAQIKGKASGSFRFQGTGELS